MRAFAHEIRRSRHRTAGCVVAAVLAVALAGCGTRSSAEEMLIDEALDATFESDTLTTTKRMLADETAMLRTGVVDGTTVCDMRIKMGDARVEMMVTDSGVYARRNEVVLWREAARADYFPPKLVEMMDDRWVEFDQARARLARRAMCDRTEQRTGLEETFLAPENRGDGKERPATLNGRPTTKITFTGGEKRVDVHVAAEGPPYLLKIIEHGGVAWTFSDFDTPYRTSAPANAIHEDELPEQFMAALQ
ncbi:hypothetical protein [Streptomyces sp. B5E4]|uniref:hypothetical protein n=1 Tax=Streptomyces sp. B5E4 TaxID=3153568 RepID=UPI00325EF2AE